MRFEKQRKPHEKLVVESQAYEGQEITSIRLWHMGNRKVDYAWMPTRRGLPVNRNDLQWLIDALTAIQTGICPDDSQAQPVDADTES